MVISSEELKSIISLVRKIKMKIDELYEELEILSNEKLVKDVKESRKEAKRGELYNWEEFEKIANEDE